MIVDNTLNNNDINTIIEALEFKDKVEQMMSIRELKGYDVLHIDEVRSILTENKDCEDK